jgi:hypothetical protein
MKQVRYLVGAVGLAPLVLAPAALATAAGTRPHAEPGHAKKVSLPQVHMAAAADCTGDTEAQRYRGSSYERFWYTPTSSVTCIGTVEFLWSLRSRGLEMRVRIWGPNLQYSNYVHGTIKPSGTYFADGVHNYYGGDFHTVEVCVAAVLSGAHSIVLSPGPICITVPG